MFQISLESGYGITTMLAVTVVSLLLVAGFYYRSYGLLRRWQWQTLLLLRMAAIVIVILLLFRPVVSYQRQLEEKPELVIALDTSGSMSIADSGEGLARFDLARRHVQSWCEKLAQVFELKLVAFAESAQALQSPAELVTLAPTGKATSLSRALEAARAAIHRPGAEGIILVSDGIHNSAGSPQQIAQQMRVKVHTVGVGASLRSDVSYRDVQIVGMDCPERMIVKNLARITAAVDAFGLAGRVVSVKLQEDDELVGEQELTLDGQEGAQKVTFEFRPEKKGRHTYRVLIDPLSDEKISQNNERTAVALVVEPGIRVLYIEGTLRAEYGAIVERFLSKDPDVEFCALVRTRGNTFLQRTNIEGLQLSGIPTTREQFDFFNVFIIGDLDAGFFQPQLQQLLVERVKAGAGLLMLGGYHSLGPGGYGQTPLAEIVPVFVGDRDIGQVTEPFVPVLTPDGAHHPIFANIVDFFPTETEPAKRSGLPPLSGCTRVAGAKPGATVLAICPVEPNKMPVLAVQPVGDGRAAVFCGDTTRNWQQAPKVLGQESPFMQFWGQMIRWLAGRTGEVKTEASITAATDKAYYEPEEPITISAVVRDEEGQGTDKATVVAEVQNPAGRVDRVELSVVPGPGGHYSAQYVPRVSGSHQIKVVAQLGQVRLEAEPLAVEVGRPNLEFDKLDLNDKLLAEIASITGGRYVHISTADQLIEQLDKSLRKRQIYVEQPLFWPPLFWALFVALVSVEWFLRRRFQLK